MRHEALHSTQQTGDSSFNECILHALGFVDMISGLIANISPTLVQFSSVAQSYLTLCVPMDCSLPGSSIQGIFQARILEWVAISSSRGSSRFRDWTCVSCVFCIAGGFFTFWAIREAWFCISNKHQGDIDAGGLLTPLKAANEYKQMNVGWKVVRKINQGKRIIRA